MWRIIIISVTEEEEGREEEGAGGGRGSVVMTTTMLRRYAKVRRLLSGLGRKPTRYKNQRYSKRRCVREGAEGAVEGGRSDKNGDVPVALPVSLPVALPAALPAPLPAALPVALPCVCQVSARCRLSGVCQEFAESLPGVCQSLASPDFCRFNWLTKSQVIPLNSGFNPSFIIFYLFFRFRSPN
jgi:hypothetical protein